MNPPKERIPKSKGWLMIGTAILCDLIGIVPFLNIVTAIASLLIFPFWFSMLGASYSKNRSMWRWTIGSVVIGAIPFLSSVLPELTLGVIRNVRYIQKEDRKALVEFNNEMNANAAAEAVRLAQIQSGAPRVPSQSGRRAGFAKRNRADTVRPSA